MNEISLAEYCEKIDDTIERGRYEEAVAHGRHVLEHYPKHTKIYWLLGKAMLEAGQYDYAADMFRRVLSANPEHMLAWVALSEIADQSDNLDAAVWYLERAFELATDNEMVAEELRQLYGRVRGTELQRLQLTPGALAKLYLRGDLLSRAISELRKLLDKYPERIDLSVALAEALWRNGQRLEASEVCRRVLDEQPYNLKANLILGEIWSSSGRAEAEDYLQRAEAVDPENEMARDLFGSASPLSEREPRITPLEYEPWSEDERPAWIDELESELPTEETALADTAEVMEAEIEIPAWLQEIAAPPTEPPAEPLEAEEAPTPPEEMPERAMALEEPEALAEEAMPEWIKELRGPEAEPVALEEGIPARPAEEEVKPPVEEAPPDEEPTAADIPDWLRDLAPPEAEAPPAIAEVEASPRVEDEAGEEPAPAEVPDWLREIAPPEAEAAEAVPTMEETPLVEEAPPTPPVEEEELPPWLEGEEMPSGDEALAWLEQIAAGKEEELLAQAEADSEARMAEIMGRPEPAPAEAPPEITEPTEAPAPAVEAPAEAPPEEAPPTPPVKEEVIPTVEEEAPPEEVAPPEMPEEAAPEVEAPPMAEEAPPVEAPIEAPEEAPPTPSEEKEKEKEEEVFGWTAFAEPEVAIPTVAEEAPPEEVVPEAPEEEEAFGWTAFAEPEEAIPTVEEAPPEEVVPEAPEEEEAFGWTAFAEPEVAIPTVEEAPPEKVALSEMLKAKAPPAEEPRITADLKKFIAARHARVEAHANDYQAWLELARALWQASKEEEAVEAYSRVVEGGKFLGEVIPDLEMRLEQWPDVGLQQTLGDAYVKDGQLQAALDIYRQALRSL